MIGSVVVGVIAAVIAAGKMAGFWSVANWVPAAFTVGGILGTLVLIWFVTIVIKRTRVDA